MPRIGANSVCRTASLAVGLFAIALATLSPSIVHAACKGWKLHEFSIKQTNGFFVWAFPRDLGGGRFEGGIRQYASKDDEPDKPDGLTMIHGEIEGSISGDDVSFTVHWDNGALGEYTGQISPGGFLDGRTQDKLNPESKAGWSQVPWGGGKLEPAAECPSVVAAPPPPPPAAPNKPVKALGKVKKVVDLGNGEIQYNYPVVKTSSGTTLPLDWCRVWANDCGKAAADVFCRQEGHQGAARFARYDGATKTWVIDDKKECDGPCASFKSIVCTKVAAANTGGGGAEYATAITPATLYVEPGGAAIKDANGDDAAMPVGSKALVLEKRTDPVWYKLQTKPVGWVWGEDMTLGP
jgi:hypothetical protein